MLQRLKLQHFKSFIDQEIELGPLVVLVGANASGKSNLFDAVRFLQGVGLGMTFTEILRGRYEGGREIWPGIRGGIHEVATKGSDLFRIESQWRTDHYAVPDESHELRHAISIATQPTPRLAAECFGHSPVPSLVVVGEIQAPEPGPARASLGLKYAHKPTGLEISTQGSFTASVRARSFLLGDDPLILEQMVDEMAEATFLDITPSRMRDYVPAAETQLGSEGENLSAVLRTLCEDPERRRALVDWLSELCAPELVDLDFVETELGDVMLELVEPGGRKIPARSLSDGTLRFLGQLIALETAEPGSLLLIEEVDSGLHPQRVHLLVEALEVAARERCVQVLATTHSPLVLAALSQESLHDAVLCARSEDLDPETAGDARGTILRRLGDLPHFDEIADRRGVDQMMITGWLERAL